MPWSPSDLWGYPWSCSLTVGAKAGNHQRGVCGSPWTPLKKDAVHFSLSDPLLKGRLQNVLERPYLLGCGSRSLLGLAQPLLQPISFFLVLLKELLTLGGQEVCQGLQHFPPLVLPLSGKEADSKVPRTDSGTSRVGEHQVRSPWKPDPPLLPAAVSYRETGRKHSLHCKG